METPMESNEMPRDKRFFGGNWNNFLKSKEFEIALESAVRQALAEYEASDEG